MNKIVEILCRRDGITRDEAIDLIEDAREQMAECNYDPFDCEDIMMSVLGLEMDYIFYLI